MDESASNKLLLIFIALENNISTITPVNHVLYDGNACTQLDTVRYFNSNKNILETWAYLNPGGIGSKTIHIHLDTAELYTSITVHALVFNNVKQSLGTAGPDSVQISSGSPSSSITTHTHYNEAYVFSVIVNPSESVDMALESGSSFTEKSETSNALRMNTATYLKMVAGNYTAGWNLASSQAFAHAVGEVQPYGT